MMPLCPSMGEDPTYVFVAHCYPRLRSGVTGATLFEARETEGIISGSISHSPPVFSSLLSVRT